jgi:acetoin utilization protein AcuB
MIPDTLVSEIMTRSLITVEPNTILDAVNELFAQHDFHHFPVVENGKLMGIISRTDIDRVSSNIDLFHSKANELANEKLFKALLAQEVMSANTVVLAPDDFLSYAATLFAENKYHALPVVEDDKLVGLVTTFDLIQHAYETKPKQEPILLPK